MFKHLLVTLDGSPRAEAVIPLATDLAKAMRSEITLLRVVGGPTSERGAMGKNPAASSLQLTYLRQAASYLERIAEQFRPLGITTHAVVKQGVPAAQIVAIAAEVDADAIAMATRSRRRVNKLMFGSVAEEVLHVSRLPILLVRAA